MIYLENKKRPDDPALYATLAVLFSSNRINLLLSFGKTENGHYPCNHHHKASYDQDTHNSDGRNLCNVHCHPSIYEYII